jgi:N-acetylglucosamine transport system substrate-binding protein
VKVRETLQPGIVEMGTYDGKFLSLNYAYSAYGIWYSEKLFAERGWQYPRTWDAMIALCKQIKAAGIAPWAYPGVHARYMSWPILAAAGKLGGLDVLKAIDNLEPNAWKHEAVRAAADAFYQLAADGLVQPGAEGMDHIQSQTEWSRGKAAFYSSGSWLENEQKAVTPPDFRMAVAPVPSLTTGDRLPFEAIRGAGSEPFVVPAKAKNVRGGLEWFRHMLSTDNAKAYSEATGSLTIVKAANDKLNLNSTALNSVKDALSKAGNNTFTFWFMDVYGDLKKSAAIAAMSDLLTGRTNADGFITAAQAAADKIAADANVTKFKRS